MNQLQGSGFSQHVGVKQDSDGFFVEPEESWQLRRAHWQQQMHVENMLLTSCPEQFRKPHLLLCAAGCSKQSPGREGTTFLSCLSRGGGSTCNAPRTECRNQLFWQWHFEPSFNCQFARRIGRPGEGGKWVCDPHKLSERSRGRTPCLVYVVGNNGTFDFEEAVHDTISPTCEIHIFDAHNWTHYGNTAPPVYAHYHVATVGERPGGTPLPELVRQLGHNDRRIDIIKIDCEGCEWHTFRGWLDVDVDIKQILVEVHGKGLATPGRNAYDFFYFLFSQGYVIFSKEPNLQDACPNGDGGNCIEYGLIKVGPQFAFTGEAGS